jgi:hypothetical protein
MNAFALESNAKPQHKPNHGPAPIPSVAAAPDRRATPSAHAIQPDPDASRALVIAVIERIESYLDEETAALQNSREFDFKASNDRKSQGLVDLNQALRRLPQAQLNADLKSRLEAFRQKLAVNLRIIRLHLDAVKELASILSDAIRDAESDGTYTRSIGPYRSAL